MTRNGISTIHRAKKMEQFSKGEKCFSYFQEKETIRRIAFFLSFSFLFSIHENNEKSVYKKTKQSFADEKYRSKGIENYSKFSWDTMTCVHAKKETKKKYWKNTRERERKERKERRRGKNWREKKLNVSPSAYKHDRSSGFSVSVLIPAWHTPYGIVFISGRPFCVLLRPFVNGRNRPVLHFTCRVCHAALLDRKEDRQKSGIVGQANYNDNWKSISIDSGESPSR